MKNVSRKNGKKRSPADTERRVMKCWSRARTEEKGLRRGQAGTVTKSGDCSAAAGRVLWQLQSDWQVPEV